MDNISNNFSKFIPNVITILSLCCGLSSIRYSLLENWQIAIFLIILAAIFDFFDGWIARKLKGDSNFGAELDSLSDFISFGVAPALLIYFWTLSEIKSLGWIPICQAYISAKALLLRCPHTSPIQNFNRSLTIGSDLASKRTDLIKQGRPTKA